MLKHMHIIFHNDATLMKWDDKKITLYFAQILSDDAVGDINTVSFENDLGLLLIYNNLELHAKTPEGDFVLLNNPTGFITFDRTIAQEPEILED